jgi:hypothetical protein
MKKILFVAIATSLALFPAGIQAQHDEIVVSSGRSVDNFVEDVSHDLDRQINRRSLRSYQMQETGVAQVLFECGPDGKPTNITMYNKSGPGIGRLARRAVSGIRSLHPLPKGVTNDQLYLANIIIANDPRQFDKLSNELNQREEQRIAAAKGDRKIFAFTLSKSPST